MSILAFYAVVFLLIGVAEKLQVATFAPLLSG